MKKLNFQASLPVTFLREGDQFVAYTPGLDLSTTGDTFEQAKKRFGEIVQIFFEECLSMGTLDSVLTDLGWEKSKDKNGKKGSGSWNPPVVVGQDVQKVSVPMMV